MTPWRGIRRPDEGADHPRPWGVASVFAVGIVIGLLLVRPTVRPPRHPHGSVASPEVPAASSGDAAGPTPDAGDVPSEAATAAPMPPPSDGNAPSVAHAVDDDSTSTSTEAAPAGEPAVPAPTEPVPMPGSHRTVLPGRLAYLQCVGLERADRMFPCPRDPALEAAAWEILLALPRCPEIDVGAGAADVRLHFGQDPAPEVRIRRVPGEPALSPEILRTCAGDALAGLRTRLRSPRMVLSLRFRTR